MCESRIILNLSFEQEKLLALPKILQLTQGSLSLPDFRMYYWVAIYITVWWWWFSQPGDNPAVTVVATLVGSCATRSNLVFQGPSSQSSLIGLMRTTIIVWSQARAWYWSLVSPHMPLRAKSTFPLNCPARFTNLEYSRCRSIKTLCMRAN